jgi:hypothetical protein
MTRVLATQLACNRKLRQSVELNEVRTKAVLTDPAGITVNRSAKLERTKPPAQLHLTTSSHVCDERYATQRCALKQILKVLLGVRIALTKERLKSVEVSLERLKLLNPNVNIVMRVLLPKTAGSVPGITIEYAIGPARIRCCKIVHLTAKFEPVFWIKALELFIEYLDFVMPWYCRFGLKNSSFQKKFNRMFKKETSRFRLKIVERDLARLHALEYMKTTDEISTGHQEPQFWLGQTLVIP